MSLARRERRRCLIFLARNGTSPLPSSSPMTSRNKGAHFAVRELAPSVNESPRTSKAHEMARTEGERRSDERSTFGSLKRLYVHLGEEPFYDNVFLLGLIVFEIILSRLVVLNVSYTEIDWEAYMEEVETWWVDGEHDYRNIRGGTGPLVYPAGFLYLFLAARGLTSNGTDVRQAQNIFLGFYVATQLVVLLLYQQTVRFLRQQQTTKSTKDSDDTNFALAHEIWSWRIAMALTCLSKRGHSIFLLRLFNDGPTMMFFYVAALLFVKQRWNTGCVVFSLAVTQKMNVLLFAPGLLLLLLQVGPDLKTVIRRLLLCCALPQLLLGAPFLFRHPVSYLRKAFELDRVFFYKWTVNWKFLPEDVFLSKSLSILLLLLHIGGLAVFAFRWIRATKKATGGPYLFLEQQPLSPTYVTSTLLVSNFIGMCFARTIHYQFYAWYWHALPYLLWYSGIHSPLQLVTNIVLLAAIESSFLTFPATPVSSAVLQLTHLAILLQLRPPKDVVVVQEQQRPKVE